MPGDLIHPNGVNGLTGQYLWQPAEPAGIAALAREPAEDPDLARELAQLGEWLQQPTFGLPFNVRPEDVSEVGWAIVFASDETDPVRQALAPLIEHRRTALGDDRVKVLDHQPGERWQDWLVRHRTTPGNLDPRRVPYYVLLVGGPGRIPFEFQYLLDVEYAVGRLHFDDVGGYRRYVSSLVDYERSRRSPRDRTATFFATRHPFDVATLLSADLLVGPLAASFRPGGRFAGAVPGYRIDAPILGAPATKAALAELMDGSTGRPAMLFAAAHGLSRSKSMSTGSSAARQLSTLLSMTSRRRLMLSSLRRRSHRRPISRSPSVAPTPLIHATRSARHREHEPIHRGKTRTSL